MIDLKKELAPYYSAREGEPTVVEVPPLQYLMVGGNGDPNTAPAYQEALQALYPVAYAIKFLCKKHAGQEFGVMPLEGLWWAENMATFSTLDKRNWLWTLMILQPEFVTKELFLEAVEQVRRKKNPPVLGRLRLEMYHEGRAAQVLHRGPYAEEGPTIQRLHQFLEEQGGTLTEATGHHHEIYLGDPRRAAPERLRTILRQPF